MSTRAPSTRETIVQAARRLFYTRGFENTSLGDLARETGIPKGNFYHHFATKDDVLRAVVEERTLENRSALERWARELPTAEQRLLRFMVMIVGERDDLIRFGCPVGSLLTELGKHSPLKEEARSTLDLYVSFVERAFVDLGFENLRARHLAEHTLARAQGAIVIAHAYGDGTIFDREVESLNAWLSEILRAHQPEEPSR